MNETYHQFNESLFAELNRGFSVPSVPTVGTPAFDSSAAPQSGVLTGRGTLVVQVTLAKGAIPVEGARVTVTGEDRVYPELQTDRSGKTPVLTLPAPNRELSQTPNSSIRPYSVYQIRITYPGYYTEDAVNVPIFDDVDSIQPVALVPLPENMPPDAEILIDESNQGPV